MTPRMAKPTAGAWPHRLEWFQRLTCHRWSRPSIVASAFATPSMIRSGSPVAGFESMAHRRHLTADGRAHEVPAHQGGERAEFDPPSQGVFGLRGTRNDRVWTPNFGRWPGPGLRIFSPKSGGNLFVFHLDHRCRSRDQCLLIEVARASSQVSWSGRCRSRATVLPASVFSFPWRLGLLRR